MTDVLDRHGTDQVAVMVVAGHDAVRRVLVDLFDSQPRMRAVASAASTAEAVAMAARHRPDLAVICPELPDLDGVGLVRALRALRQPPRVLVVSPYADAVLASEAADAGASAVVNLGANGQHIVDVARRVGRGYRELPARRAGDPLSAHVRQLSRRRAAAARRPRSAHPRRNGYGHGRGREP